MSGLFLLKEYGGEDDSQSEEESDCKVHTSESKKLIQYKLPTPNLSKVPVVPVDNHVDDLSLHGGRIRSFPHVRGNWATYVYIEYPDKTNLHTVIDKLEKIVSNADDSCYKCEDIHISLSKTFVLKYHMINSFTKSLKEVLSDIESFELGFNSVEVYCNEENTRTFLALKVDFFSKRYLLNITEKIDEVLDEYHLPKFYEDPSFHMSILTVNGNKKDKILNILDKLNEHFTHLEENTLETLVINKVNCKSGNKNYQYYLK